MANDWHHYGQYVIYECLIGSKAYGLATPTSDDDIRGVYLAPATEHWSLRGVPDQIKGLGQDEVYFELGHFLALALKANPTILEILFSPRVSLSSPLAEELRALGPHIISKKVYHTYRGFAQAQFRKIEQAVRNQGDVDGKNAMHLIRALICLCHILETGQVKVDMSDYRDKLLAIRSGELSWERTQLWRDYWECRIEGAYQVSTLREEPDFELVNDFLVRARLQSVIGALSFSLT